MDEEPRKLSEAEHRALIKMANQLPDVEMEMLVSDLKRCRVIADTKDGSRFLFLIDGYPRPAYLGQHAYPTEGVVKDVDGADLTVCIYADHQDRLLELELIKWTEQPIREPNWDTFAIRY